MKNILTGIFGTIGAIAFCFLIGISEADFSDINTYIIIGSSITALFVSAKVLERIYG